MLPAQEEIAERLKVTAGTNYAALGFFLGAGIVVLLS
jgi:hypothetical protein